MIDRAVIPAAGLGTRMLPITKSIPKEMLPAGRRPIIQRVVEEAVASGLSRICIVIRKGKEIIRDYFSNPYAFAQKRGEASIEELEKLVAGCSLTFIEQDEPRGLGDALLQAREFVGPDPFVMMIPDQLMRSMVPAAHQLIQKCKNESGIWTSLVSLPKTERAFFAGARGFEFSGDKAGPMVLGKIQTEEETRAAYAPFDYEIRGFGRTVYPPEIFDYLGPDFTNPQTGEVDLLRTFAACAEALGHRGVLLEGEACDMGTFEGYYRYLPRFFGGDA